MHSRRKAWANQGCDAHLPGDGRWHRCFKPRLLRQTQKGRCVQGSPTPNRSLHQAYTRSARGSELRRRQRVPHLRRRATKRISNFCVALLLRQVTIQLIINAFRARVARCKWPKERHSTFRVSQTASWLSTCRHSVFAAPGISSTQPCCQRDSKVSTQFLGPIDLLHRP